MTDPPSLWRRLLVGWLEIALRFGEVQTLVLLGWIYALAFGPVALVAQGLRRDLLGKRGLHEPGTAWREADTRPPALENVKQPF